MTKHKVWRVILIVLIVLTLIFIWSNSLLGRESSSQKSGEVRATIQQLLNTIAIPVQLTDHLVRKMAHFVEYFLLGAEMALYSVCCRTLMRRDIGNMLTGLFGAAFLDETLQIFSGRGPAIADVWLDAAGGVTAMLLVFALYFLITACRRRGKKQR